MTLVLLTCFGLFPIMPAQQPLDGRERILHDELLDNLAGDWKISPKFKTRTVENTAKVEWVLNHQFSFDQDEGPEHPATIRSAEDTFVRT
jgi:hypothetical protein